MALEPTGNSLYWLEFRGDAPTVHRFDAATKVRTDFGFSIGAGDAYNVRGSELVVVTAEPGTGRYLAYDARKPNTSLGVATLPPPTGGVKWWSYNVDNNAAYVVTTDAPGATKLYRWATGEEPEMLTTLEAAGAGVGEFYDFAVENDRMVFVESGRLWTMDLRTKKATRIPTNTEVGHHIEFTSDSVFFAASSPTRLIAVDLADGSSVTVSDRIAASSYAINDTFKSSHLWTGGQFTRWQSWIIYVGGDGVFGFDRSTGRVVPILLNTPLNKSTATARITYEHPVALTGGSLFVAGLESESGSVGAEGPIYSVDLRTVLQ